MLRSYFEWFQVAHHAVNSFKIVTSLKIDLKISEIERFRDQIFVDSQGLALFFVTSVNMMATS